MNVLLIKHKFVTFYKDKLGLIAQSCLKVLISSGPCSTKPSVSGLRSIACVVCSMSSIIVFSCSQC